MNPRDESKPLYWIRFEFEQDGTRLTDVVEFPTRELMDLGLARLHVYPGEDFLLASSGERPWPAGYEPHEPRSWRAFLKALEANLDLRRVVKGPIKRQAKASFPFWRVFTLLALIGIIVCAALLR